MKDPIATADIAAAEKLMAFLCPHRAVSDAGQYRTQILSTKARRKVLLSNSTPMASRLVLKV